MAGYHTTEIKRGEYGEFSKIIEEALEAEDAYVTGNPVMVLQELSDLLGAIEGYTLSKFNISMDNLLTMSQLTQKVFREGYRVSR